MEKIVSKDWLKAKLYVPCEVCQGLGYVAETYGYDNGAGIPVECPRCDTVKVFPSPNQTVILGRALVAIYNQQTADEKANVSTKYKNGVGFTGSDAKLGSLCAKKFIADKNLAPWMLRVWLVEKNGYPRICKYAGQLNRIANEKKNEKVPIHV